MVRLVKDSEEEIILSLKVKEYYTLFSPPLPSLSNTALSSWFGDDKSAEFWDEELLFKYVNM